MTFIVLQCQEQCPAEAQGWNPLLMVSDITVTTATVTWNPDTESTDVVYVVEYRVNDTFANPDVSGQVCLCGTGNQLLQVKLLLYRLMVELRTLCM